MYLCNTSARLGSFVNLRYLILLNCNIWQETFEQIGALSNLRQLQCIECPFLMDFGFLARLKLRCFILVTEQMKISLPQGKFSIMLVIVRGSVYRKSCDCLLSEDLEKRLRNIKLINNNVYLGASEQLADRRESHAIGGALLAPVAPQKGASLKSQLQIIGKDNILATDLTSSTVIVRYRTQPAGPVLPDQKARLAKKINTIEKNGNIAQEKPSEHAKANKPVKPERKAAYKDDLALNRVETAIDASNGAQQRPVASNEETAVLNVKQLPKKPQKPAKLRLQCDVPFFEPPRCRQYGETQDAHFVFKKPTKPASKRAQPPTVFATEK